MCGPSAVESLDPLESTGDKDADSIASEVEWVESSSNEVVQNAEVEKPKENPSARTTVKRKKNSAARRRGRAEKERMAFADCEALDAIDQVDWDGFLDCEAVD